MHKLIIRVKLHPGAKDKYIAEFRKIAPAVRSESGCCEYEVFVDSADPRFDNEVRENTLILCEKWESIEALQQHMKGKAFLEFKERVKDMRQSSSYELLVSA